MANYNIQPVGTVDIAQELAAVTRTLEASLQTLQTSVQRFTVANDGAAPEAYAAAQSLWNQGQEEMRAVLAKGHLSLNEIVDAYVYGDKRGAAAFGG